MNPTSNQEGQFTDEFKASIDHLFCVAKKQEGEKPSEEFVNAFEKFNEFPREQSETMWHYFAREFKQIESPLCAGYMAIAFGSRIERYGANPEPGIPQLLDYFMHIIEADYYDEENDSYDIDDETKLALEFFGRSLVAHLSRCPEQRRVNFVNAEIIETLEQADGVSVAAAWVLEILRKRSGELIVLHTEHLVGVRVKYQNISNCFHLFSLLQIELEDVMPGAKEANEEVLEALQAGGGFDCSDQAWWDYTHDDSLGELKLRWVFGELSPELIGKVEGEQVLLLSEPSGGRGWDSGFFKPYLAVAPSGVELLMELSKKEVNEWLSRLKYKPV